MKKKIGMSVLVGIFLCMIVFLSIKVNKNDCEEITKITQDYDYSNKDAEFFAKTLFVKADHKVQDDTAKTITKYEDFYILQYESEDLTKQAYEKFKKDTSIEWVETESVVKNASENVEIINNDEIDSDEVMTTDGVYQNMPVDSKDIVVAVIDTGYDIENMGNDRIIDTKLNYSTSGKDGSIQDDNGHGTQMSSIILANTNECVKVMPIKVLNGDGIGSTLSVYSGIKYAIKHNVSVINISMTSYKAFDSEIIRDAIKEAKDKGIFVVVAAGNQNTDISHYAPANVEDAIVVSAINNDLNKSTYSNYGKGIDFCAYGSTNAFGLNKEAIEVSGTSVSTAIVSTVIANCKILDNNYTYDEIYKLLLDNTYDLGDEGYDNYFGNGALGTSTVTGLFEQYVCEEAKIFTCDWKHMSDKELNEIIRETTDINLSLFLQTQTSHLNKRYIP